MRNAYFAVCKECGMLARLIAFRAAYSVVKPVVKPMP